MKTYTEEELREALATLAPADAPPVDMWPRVRSRVAGRRRVRVALSVVGAVAATTAAVVAWPGPARDSVGPSAGADSLVVVTLAPNGSQRHGVTPTATILHVLRQRLDALAINGATVEAHDDVFQVTVRSTDTDRLGLADQGELQLRQVLEVAPRSGFPASWSVGTASDLNGAESLFSRSSCSDLGKHVRTFPLPIPASRYLVACSLENASEYLLGPSSVGTADVAAADAQSDQTGGWVVDLRLTEAGATAWQQLTGKAAQQPPMQHCQPPAGCNGIGVLVDGRIISVPSVQGRAGLAGGMVEIAVASREEAQALAVELTHPLPVDLDYVSKRTAR